ncbi:unnamed protein product [Aphanomyces euteiches]
MEEAATRQHAHTNTVYHCLYAYYKLGFSRKHLALVFNKSERTIGNWINVYKTTGSYQRAQNASCERKQSDRAGATTESSLHEIVDKLQERWGTIFSAEAVVWRMWANDVTRNLNRLTWDDVINQLPSNYISSLLRPVDSHFQHHFQYLSRSTSVALDCVKASIADNEQLLSEWEAFGHRLKMQKEQLQSRKLIVEAFIRDLPPPGLNAVEDPLAALDNIDDEEHKDED